MLHERLKNIEQQNSSVIWTFVTFCVLVVSFPALYVFLCRLICPSNQSRYSVVWWRNISRRNNLIILPYTKKNWFGNLWLPRSAVSQRLTESVSCSFLHKVQRTGQNFMHMWTYPEERLIPPNVSTKCLFGSFTRKVCFLGSPQKTPPVVKYWHLTKGRWPNALFQLWPVIIMMCRWIGGNLSVIGLEYRGMFQADCPLEQNSSGCALIWRILWPNSLFQFIPLPLLWNNIKVKLLQILFANVGKQTQPKHKFKHWK